ncbi:MAG: ATP-binding cassette domain-containing protein [Nitratireductor sp.]|nr:ATP-binding cassette domain-containing protein [Nitratireductor sp.]MCB1458981.1 ATP-binding cassette domain-containing protein [Nitratireductor sp.]
MAGAANKNGLVVEVRDLTVHLGQRDVLSGLSIDVRRGEILGIVGSSGSGKSVLLRTIIGLLPKTSGTIKLFSEDTSALGVDARQRVQRRTGVMFQHGALFSSLTVRQNLQFQMRENLAISQRMMDEMTDVKLEMVGLSKADGDKLPAQLSGGMTKRVALARALVLDPEFVLLDEPTSGLDPISAGDFDELIRTLQTTLGLTVFLVTHDLSSLYAITDRIAVVSDGRIVADGNVDAMLKSNHPWVKSYFRGSRGSVLARGH